MATFHGSCLCGELEFQYDGPSLWCAHCHCTMCQRAHGTALVRVPGHPAPGTRLNPPCHLEMTRYWDED